MEDIRYSKEHMWARLDDDDRVTIGITDFAAGEWGEIVSVSLPEESTELVKDEVFGRLDAANSVMDLYSPVSGEVSEVNEDLQESPEIINEDPLQDGWLVRMVVPSLADFDELLTEEEYEEYLKEELDYEPEDGDEVEELGDVEALGDEDLDEDEDLMDDLDEDEDR